MPSHVFRFEEDKVTHEPVAIVEGRFNLADLVGLLREMEERTGKMPAALTAGSINITPIVSHETGEPRVELQSPAFDKPLQLDFGHALIETAVTAMSDAMIFGFLSGELKVPAGDAARVLYSMRQFRDRMLANNDQDKGQPS